MPLVCIQKARGSSLLNLAPRIFRTHEPRVQQRERETGDRTCGGAVDHVGVGELPGRGRRRDFGLCTKAALEGVWAPRELPHTFVSVMSEPGVAVAEIARLAGHSSSGTTETIYRRELRPVITVGTDVMDKIFI